MPFSILIAMLILGIFLKSPTVKGFLGELGVRFALRKLDKEKFKVIHDITLQNGEKTAQIDHIVIGTNGIFVIETKNYKGWIFGSERASKWTQTIYKSKKRFQNPIHQNYGHIKVLERSVPDFPRALISIINFSSNSTLKAIDVQSQEIHVLQTPLLVKTILSYNEEFLSAQQAEQYAGQIEQARLSGRDVKRKHVQDIKQTQQSKQKLVKGNQCPKCGQPLIARKGKHGSFKGCTAYPRCRFTA
ncbi:MAG TPA: NERD domain-containing protein [Planococcus sp. (in: firmicutes)]|nr:NERD domain-containing protein [Planococcus sp. (in: firmicutes)]